MISNINSLGSNNYVQAFSAKTVKNKENKNNSSGLGFVELSRKNAQLTSTYNNLHLAMVFSSQVQDIKKEEVALSSENIVKYDDLTQLVDTIDTTGKSPAEVFWMKLNTPDLFLLNEKPYTGTAKEIDKNGSEIYVNYNKGVPMKTFIKNQKTGLSGYTDDKAMVAKYYKETKGQKVLLSTVNVSSCDGIKTYATLTTLDSKGIKSKSYEVTGSINDFETQKLNTDVKKYFGDEIGEEYYIF